MPIAVTIAAPGGPEVLRPARVAVAAPQAGQVRIRQTTIGVNFVDIYFRRGLYPLPACPAVLGLEGAGTVEAVGPQVDTLRPGDRIAYVGYPLGAYAEVRILPAARLVRLPEEVSERTAGSSMLRGLTAHMLLHEVRRLRAGDPAALCPDNDLRRGCALRHGQWRRLAPADPAHGGRCAFWHCNITLCGGDGAKNRNRLEISPRSDPELVKGFEARTG